MFVRRVLCPVSKSILFVSAVRVDWETYQLTTERYVSDHFRSEKLTYFWKTHLGAESELWPITRQVRTGVIPNEL